MSLAGKWNVTMPTSVGARYFVWELSEVDGVWRGQMFGRGPIKDSVLTAIRLQGTSVSFATSTHGALGSIDLEFQGELKGDTLTGRCKSAHGNSVFTAVRVTDAV